MKEIGKLYWVKTIESFEFIKGNRCNITNEEDALEEGFTMKQIKRLKARVKKLGTMGCFNKFGWMEEHPMVVYVFEGKKYLGDGQGRGLYASAYNLNIDDAIKTGDATENDYIMIPVREYEVDSFSEMLDRVIVQNQYGTVWNKMEIIQAECELSDNPDKSAGFGLIKRYSNELDIAESVISDALFGQGSTKKDADVIYLSKQRPYARRYLKFLGELYKACKKAGWDAKLMRRIHGGNFVRTMQYNVLDKIVHNHKLSDEDKLHYFNEATKIFLEAIPLFTVHQAVNLSGECPFVGSNMLKMLAKSRNTFFKEEFAYAKETTNAFV